MKTTWIVGGWLVALASTALAQQQTPSPVDRPQSHEFSRDADRETEPLPATTLHVHQGVKPSVVSPSLLMVPLPRQSPLPADHVPHGLPHYATPKPHSASILDTKESHLRKAAEHLKSAGLEDDAARFSQLADAERQRSHQLRNQRLLQQKEAELHLLQQEVERLRGQVGSPEQVMLDIQVIELPIGKLRERAEESDIVKSLLEDVAELLPGAGRPSVVDADSKSLAALHTLLAYGGKILDHPKLVGTNGRPARYHKGGAFQIKLPNNDGEPKSETRLFGTQVEFTPHMLSDGRIRVELDVRLSEPEKDQTGKVSNPPRLSIREFNTVTELSASQVLVSASEWQQSTTGTVAAFFVVRLHQIEAIDVKLPTDSQPTRSDGPMSIPR